MAEDKQLLEAGGVGNNFDDFLSSMTFANGADFCDCDECPDYNNAGGSIPPDMAAVEEHKRKRKLEQQPTVFESSKRLYIRQNRQLIKREHGFSLWRLDLPHGDGDPIVEYRNSHRILFVKQLNNQTSHVLSIGKGIIGSAAEENGRKRVHWEQGSSYFLPCSKNIACGWIHKLASSSSGVSHSKESDSAAGGSGATTTDDVIIYALKVSPETLQSMEGKDFSGEGNDGVSCWVKESCELFRQCLAKQSPPTHLPSEENGKQMSLSDASTAINDGDCGVQLSEAESLDMELIIGLFHPKVFF